MEKVLKLSSDTSKLHQMFGPKLYSDKYSFISEICQNAVDSHRMAKKDIPIEVSLSQVGHQWEFKVEDFGISFENEDDFDRKVCTILESGKSSLKTSDESCAMGEHGIGSISPSTYVREWFFDVRTPSGTNFTYAFRWREETGLVSEVIKTPKVNKSTTGVVFSCRFSPDGHFITNLKNKLCYFKDVKFNFDKNIADRYDRSLYTINTSFRLFQSEDFQYSTLNPLPTLHISLDQYSYQIRWDKLGIDPIRCPIALKFTMADGLRADITRENLMISDGYVVIIKAKIKKVAEWMMNKINADIEKDGYESIESFIAKSNQPAYITIEDHTINVHDLLKYSSLPKHPIFLKGVSKHVQNVVLSNHGYGLISTLCTGFIKITESRKAPLRYPRGNRLIFMEDETIPKREAMYIAKHLPEYTLCKFRELSLRKKYPVNIKAFFRLSSSTKLREYYKSTGKNIWREELTGLDKLREYMVKDYGFYFKDLKVPSTFSYEVVKKPRVKREKTEIVYRDPYNYRKTVSEEELKTKKFVYVLEPARLESRLLQISNYLSCVFGRISQAEEKRIKNRKMNAAELSDFLKTETPQLVKLGSIFNAGRLLSSCYTLRHVPNKSFIAKYVPYNIQVLDKFNEFHKLYTSLNLDDKFKSEIIKLAQKSESFDRSYTEIVQNYITIQPLFIAADGMQHVGAPFRSQADELLSLVAKDIEQKMKK